jgi:hypothetical protein
MFLKFVIKIALLSLLLTFPLNAFSKVAENHRSKITSMTLMAGAPRQNELLVIGALKNLYTAEAAYFLTVTPSGNAIRHFGSLPQLAAANLIDAALATGEKYGYSFAVVANQTNPPVFTVGATPKSYGKTGTRSFYFDGRCTIRGGDKNGLKATIDDAVVESCTPTLAYENERQAIQGLRTLFAAEETYRATLGNGDYTFFYSLYQAGLINSWLASGQYYNYGFQINWTSPLPPFPASMVLRNEPFGYGQMGFRSFYIDNTGVLRGADHQGGYATANDPPVEEGKEGN